MARKFKLYCALNGIEQKEVIKELLEHLFQTMDGRPDGQTAIYQIEDDLMKDDEVTSSSNLDLTGRPDGQDSAQNRKEVLIYYVKLTGNPVRQNDRDYLETILDLPVWAIKAGIGISVFKCKTRVGSLRYCHGAIMETHQSGATDSYLQAVERALQRSGKLPAIEPPSPTAKQPALPNTGAGELTDLNHRKESQ